MEYEISDWPDEQAGSAVPITSGHAIDIPEEEQVPSCHHNRVEPPRS
jgi:hypothetical protein